MEHNAVEILLVEDNPDDAKLTIRALTKNKLANNLLHLRDGEAALAYLNDRTESTMPKLILLDLKMPKVNGIEVLEKIKSHPMLKQIPVVMMTSSQEEQDIVKSYKLGVNAYIVKPVSFDNFIDVVAEVGFFWMVLNKSPK
jgi:two-component system, response regulator